MQRSEDIRPAAVAGTFYPGVPDELAWSVDHMLSEATPPAAPPGIKALIVPHAGYIYSGPVAATAYVLLRASRKKIKRVVLLGPAHRVPVSGLSLPAAHALATPLGVLHVAQDAWELPSRFAQVTVSARAHAQEHSLEVHLPFLQRVLDNFTIVPLAVGDASVGEVAEVLEAAWGGPETLIVISTDLSHYLPYEEAQRVDAETVRVVAACEPTVSHEQACGATPLNGLLELARRRDLAITTLDVRNSGDTAGPRDRVVGYGAFAVSA